MTCPTDTTIAQDVNRRAAESTVPLSVLIEVTRACNLRCYYCYQTDHTARDELSLVQWRDILDRLERAGTLYLAISGGEPFMRTDIFDIIEHARRCDFAVSIISNGTRISAEKAKRLSGMAVMDVGISLLAADAALHDELSGVEGSHDAAIRALHVLKDEGVNVVVKHTVSARNFGEYRRLLDMADREEWLFEADSMVVPLERGTVSPWALTEEQHARFLSDMRYRPVPFPDNADPRRPNLHCDAGRSLCGITPAGEVVPCIQLPIVLGSLVERSFDEIWNGEAARRFRIQEEDLAPECRACPNTRVCTRCHGIAFAETGTWRGKSPSLCLRTAAVGGLND